MDLTAVAFAAEALVAGDFAAGALDFAGMARMWAVGRRESMQVEGAVNHSAGCIAGTRAGLSRAQSRRSNRQRSGVPRTAQNKASAPITPAVVTRRETVP